MARLRRTVETWGTVLSFDFASRHLSIEKLESAYMKCSLFVRHIDEVFSTYRSGSAISQIRRSEVTIEELSPEVQEVWRMCAQAKYLSDGAFDPWAVEGGFDPSGLVKGWAADKCAEMALDMGIEHMQLNFAGDLTVRGGELLNDGSVIPWSIGVVNPDNTLEVLQIFKMMDGAVATSGDYERGAHIRDPFSGTIAIGARSATVLGPDGALADAMATALMVTGEDGAKFFGQPELDGYSAWVINRNENTSWALGPAFN